MGIGAGSEWERRHRVYPVGLIGGPLVGGLRDLGGRLFPERQLLVRSTERVRSVLLPGWLQAMIVVACIGTLGGASYLTVGYFSLHREADHTAAVASNTPAMAATTAQP